MQAQRNRLSATKVNLIVDGSIFAAFLVATAPHFTGMPIHEWLGIAFGADIITHLLLHWSWLVATTRRIFTTAPRQARINYVLNTLLFIDITLLVFTGLMISKIALPQLDMTLSPGILWRSLHTATADAAVIVGLHVALHWGWITKSVSRYLLTPVADGLRQFAPSLSTQTAAAPKESLS
jgi:cytochrome b